MFKTSKIRNGHIFTLLLYLELLCDGITDAVNPRIVGGITTDIGSMPYVMQIWWDGQFICGGSLVNIKSVVTAGHCCYGTSAQALTVVGGARKLSDKGIRQNVTKIVMHPKFDPDTLNYDIAVLQLAMPMCGNDIGVIALYRDRLYTGIIGQVSGWGKTNENAVEPSSELRTVKIPIVSIEKCIKQYSGQAVIRKSMFCGATADYGKDACAGDSGGPFACDKKLCGVVSWGVGCARRSYPGVYARIQIDFVEGALAHYKSKNVCV